MSVTLQLQFAYHGGDADDRRLDAYDAAVSLQGISRALAITTHALLNDGQVKVRASRAEGAQIYFYAPRRGSFVEIAEIIIENPEIIGVSVAGNAFYDFLRWSWHQATGNTRKRPETPFVRNLADRRQELADEIGAGLESPLSQAQRPISSNREMDISVNRRRTGQLINLNADTLSYVETRASEAIDALPGNVTRFNYLSGIGRMYDSELQRTVPFELTSKFPGDKVTYLPWSMSEAIRGNEQNLLFEGQRLQNARGDVKRILISDVSPITDEKEAI